MTDQTELADRLRGALRATDGNALAELLAEEVEWLGSRGGACRGAGEVLAVVLPLPGEILDGSPGPRQEMRVSDPDGYCLMVAQIEGEPMEERPGEPR